MLTSKQRAILRGKANTMDPVYIVGKGEIDETLIQGVKDCLDARVLEALRRASEGRTVLSVSHRIYENLGGRTVEVRTQTQ